jgi:hypothetical protein
MENILLSLIPTLSNTLIEGRINKNAKLAALQSLKKVLLVECRINLKILDITKNERIEKPEIFKLLSNLNNEASKTIFSYVDYSIVKPICEMLIKSKDVDSIENDLFLVSIISKIELLKILAKDFEKLSGDRVVNIQQRINNLHKQLSEIVIKLNNEIVN